MSVVSWALRRRSAVWGAAVLLFAMTGTAAATAGAMLHLGVGNSSAATTTLNSAVNGPVLVIASTASTGATSARALAISVPEGRAPITVSPRSGRATHLDADKLDGFEGSAFLQRTQKAADSDKVDGVDSAVLSRGRPIRIERTTSMSTVPGSFTPVNYLTQTFVQPARQAVTGFAAEVTYTAPPRCGMHNMGNLNVQLVLVEGTARRWLGSATVTFMEQSAGQSGVLYLSAGPAYIRPAAATTRVLALDFSSSCDPEGWRVDSARVDVFLGG